MNLRIDSSRAALIVVLLVATLPLQPASAQQTVASLHLYQSPNGAHDIGQSQARFVAPAATSLPEAPVQYDDEPPVAIPGETTPSAPCHTCEQCCPCPNHLCCPPCGPPGWLWVRGEYLHWSTDGDHLPPLVTTSPAGTPLTEAGVLGLPGTSVLFGGEEVNDDHRSGGRITLGAWLDPCQTWGVEGDYFTFESQSTGFSLASSGDPIIARPFFNVQTGSQDSLLVAFPGLVVGSIDIQASSSDYESAGVRMRHLLLSSGSCSGCNRLDLIGGYRYASFSDELTINEVEISDNQGGVVPLGTRFDLTDAFSTGNEFHGGEVGLLGSIYRGCWSLELLGKVALGNNHQTLSTTGVTTLAIPGIPSITRPGGFLVDNSAEFARDEFTLIPEIGVNLGYNFSPCWRAFVGYTFIYWSDVVRAGEQVDLNVDPSLLGVVDQAAPRLEFNGSDFWAQGISAGLELRR